MVDVESSSLQESIASSSVEIGIRQMFVYPPIKCHWYKQEAQILQTDRATRYISKFVLWDF